MTLAANEIIESVDRAWYILTGVSLVLMIGIMGTLVVFVFKYHRSRHPRAEKIHGNTKLEITWTVLPTILGIWLFFVGYHGFALMRDPPKDAYVVEVEGRQWAWTFRYPEEGVTSTEMYVPQGKAIRCNVSAPADDVVHSFYLPHFRVKEDCVPGQPNFLWFQADEIGVYNIFCAEFCGKDHAQMHTKLHVVSQEDFDAWLDMKLEHRYRPISDVAAVMDSSSEEMVACHAADLFKTYCASCHGPKGEGGLVEGARSFQSDPASKWKRSVKIPDIFRTITLGLDGTRMKPFANLSAWDRFALAHFVAHLHEGGAERSQADRTAYDKLIKEYKLDEQRKISREFPINEAIDDIVSRTR